MGRARAPVYTPQNVAETHPLGRLLAAEGEERERTQMGRHRIRVEILSR